MGLFSRNQKRSEKHVTEKSDQYILKEDLERDIANLQSQFNTKQADFDLILDKLKSVKEEYDTAVANLMSVKKETNQTKMEFDLLQKNYKDVQSKLLNADKEFAQSKKTISDLDRAKETLIKIKQNLDKVTLEYNQIKINVKKEQDLLDSLKSQQTQTNKEIDEANVQLHNLRQAMSTKPQDMLPDEKQLLEQSNSSDPGGVIKAASVVVASIKAKLNSVEEELETTRTALKKEKLAHEQTLKKLNSRI